MTQGIEIKNIRKIFTEIISFLNSNNFRYWLGGGLTDNIPEGYIDDDKKNHDIDFHVLEADHERLETCLRNSGYRIRQNKKYKIRLSGDNDQRGIEFVFLKPINKYYEFQSRDIVYKLPQRLFKNGTLEFLDKRISIPSPIEEYVTLRQRQRATGNFHKAVKNSPEFYESIEIIRRNSSGNCWLIGGFVYRSIADSLYGSGRPKVDLDFIVEYPLKDLSLPQGWTQGSNRYGNPKLIKNSGISIDFVPLQNISSILRRKITPTIDNFLTGTPLTIQSIAYDARARQIIGDIGIKALVKQVVAINDAQQAEIYAQKKQKPINDIIQEKAEALGFKPVLAP